MLYVLIIILVCTALLAGGLYFSSLVLKPKKYDYDYTRQDSINKGEVDPEYFDKLPKEEFYLESDYGYKIHAMFFPNNASKKTIVFCHGFTWSLYGSVKYMTMFYKRGFNVFIYDHRYHGKSGGNEVSMGYHEKNDLKQCLDWVYKRTGEDSIVGTHGESMGAATVLQHLSVDKRPAFCIADCGFSDLNKLLRIRINYDFKIPAFPFLYLCSIISFFRIGTIFDNISPVKDMDKIETPIFFIHGKEDKYIPPEMSIEMYEKKKGQKRLYLCPGARHAGSYMTDPERYEKEVVEFLKEINLF